jgi:hypothetical protein
MPVGSHFMRRALQYIAGGAKGRWVVQISLHSTHWTQVRRIGAKLTAMSEVVFNEIRRGCLTPDEARAILVTVVPPTSRET